MRWAWLRAGMMVLFLAGGCSTSGSTPAERSSILGTTHQPIQGGSEDTTHRFAVGVCNGSPGQCYGVCSGALILPNVVATARHCVDASPITIRCQDNPTFGDRDSGSFYVTTNARMTMGGSAGWYKVKSIAVPEDNHVCGSDMALLVLTSQVPESDTPPIIPGVQYQMWDPSQYEPVLTAIGYGVTGPNKDDAQTRRIRKDIDVQCIPGSDNLPCPSDATKYFHPTEFWAGDGTCSGDSGSSAFEQKSLEQGAPVSFGVLSRGSELTPDGGEAECYQSFYTRFDAHRDFVLQVAKTASVNWSLYPEPSWTAYKPPPVKKDAGAEGGVTKTPLGDLGDACAKASDCKSNVCSDTGDGSTICSKACDESDPASCDDGYSCRESVCLPGDPAPAPTVTTTIRRKSGCLVTPGAPACPSEGVALAVATVMWFRRRRRNARAEHPT